MFLDHLRRAINPATVRNHRPPATSAPVEPDGGGDNSPAELDKRAALRQIQLRRLEVSLASSP